MTLDLLCAAIQAQLYRYSLPMPWHSALCAIGAAVVPSRNAAVSSNIARNIVRNADDHLTDEERLTVGRWTEHRHRGGGSSEQARSHDSRLPRFWNRASGGAGGRSLGVAWGQRLHGRG
jgi:hypothetical protein